MTWEICKVCGRESHTSVPQCSKCGVRREVAATKTIAFTTAGANAPAEKTLSPRIDHMTPLQKAAREFVEKAHRDLQTIVSKFAVENNMLPFNAERRLEAIGAPDYRAAKKRFEEAYTIRHEADVKAGLGR